MARPASSVRAVWRILVAQGGHGQQQPGEGRQVVSFVGGETQPLHTLFFVGLRAGHAQHPAHGRRAAAQQVILHADGEVGVVTGGIDQQQLLRDACARSSCSRDWPDCASRSWRRSRRGVHSPAPARTGRSCLAGSAPELCWQDRSSSPAHSRTGSSLAGSGVSLLRLSNL